MYARFDIRLALTDSDRRAISRLRRQGIPSQNQGLPSQNGDSSEVEGSWGNAELIDAHDENAYVFGAFDGNRAVAAIRLHVVAESSGGPDAKALNLEVFGHYHPNRLGTVSGFVIAKHIERDAQLVAAMTQQVICIGYLHRMEFICGAFESQWLPLLETLGWRRYLHLSACPDLRGEAPLCFVLSDVEHLRRVGSPHTALAGAFGRNQFAAAHFENVRAKNARPAIERRQVNSDSE